MTLVVHALVLINIVPLLVHAHRYLQINQYETSSIKSHFMVKIEVTPLDSEQNSPGGYLFHYYRRL